MRGILTGVSIIGAVLLLFAGLVGLSATWNATRPVRNPTRRYSAAWLPSMVVSQIPWFWLLAHVVVLLVGLGLGGWSNRVGRTGAAFLVVSIVALAWIMIRTSRAVRRLRRMVEGPIHGTSVMSRLIGQPVPTPAGVTEEHGIEWSDGLTLDLIRPAGGARDLPVLVYVHGGGWTGGSPQRQGRDMYHALALDGWATLAIRYPFTPEVTVERQIATVQTAVRWARSSLAEHGVDATHVALAGGSAGAHLAAIVALSPDDPFERVAACVGLYGVYDMANRNRTRAPWAKTRHVVMRASVAEAPDRYRAVSPLDQIGSDSPPILLMHGTRDTLVPIGEATQFAAALRAAGRPVELIAVGGAEHAFDALSSPTTRAVAAVVRTWLRETVLETT